MSLQEHKHKFGRAHQLSAEQANELKRRYQLWRDNSPKRLCADFGISRGSLAKYVTNGHRRPVR